MKFRQLMIAALCGVLIVTLAPVAFAQQMPPLKDLPSDVEQHHPYTRCASLYFSVASWFGSDRLGTEAFNSYREAVGKMSQAAMLVRATAYPEEEVASNGQKVIAEIQEFGRLYVDRMKRGFAENSNLLMDDPLIRDDLAACDFYAKFANEILQSRG